MSSLRSTRFPTKRLKHVVTLRRSPGTGEDVRPYVGLEAIESWTGKLVDESPTSGDGPLTSGNGTSLSRQFEQGDVLFGKLRPYLAKAWIAEFPGRCTTELLVMRPADVLSQYLLYVCLSVDFIAAVDALTFGSRMPRADWNVIGDLHIPVPSIAEQRTIIATLDRHIARLDALVAEEERILSLLEDRQNAIIARAVTRGLNPDAPLRNSGISWLGEIPEHWDTERARWLFTERDERSATGEEELLTVSHLTGVTPRSQKNVNMFEAATTEGYKTCIAGDLVVNTMWAWMGAMGVAPMDGIVSPAYNVYEPRACLYPGYAAALTRLPVFAQEAARHSKGVWSSRLRLYPHEFFAISLPVPPVAEQREIATHVDRWTAKLAELRVAMQATLALIKERRAALIAAAVSGHLNVDGEA